MNSLVTAAAETWATTHLKKVLDRQNVTELLENLNGEGKNGTADTKGNPLKERELAQYIADRFRSMQHLIPFIGGDAAFRAAVQEVVEAVERDEADVINNHESSSSPSRHLLQNEEEEEGGGEGEEQNEQAEAVRALTSLSGGVGGYTNILLDNTVADTFLEGPFFWPPRFTYWENDRNGEQPVCAAGAATLEILSESVHVMTTFYNEDYRSKFRSPPWDLKTNLPKFYNGTPVPPPSSTAGNIVAANATFRISSDRIAQRGGGGGGDWAATFFNFYAVNILEELLGITPAGLQAFFTTYDAPGDALTLGNVMRDMLVCDFEEVVTCNGHRRNIVLSFIMAYIIYWLMATVLGYMGIQGHPLLYLLVVISLTFWLAYSMAPTCVGMLPSCLLTDLLGVVDAVFPATVLWPNSLQVNPECVRYSMLVYANVTDQNTFTAGVNNKTVVEQIPCMRSCREEPFNFRSWEATIAWMSCGLDPVECVNVSVPYFPELRNAAVNQSRILLAAEETGDMDLVHGYSFCFWATMAQAVPFLFLLIILLVLIVSLFRVPGILLVAWVEFIMQVVAYSHVD